MKWEETVVSGTRYGECAREIFGGMEIIWEDSEDQYEGYGAVLAVDVDRQYHYCHWVYGPCMPYDEWDDADMTHEQIVAQMRYLTVSMSSDDKARRFSRDLECPGPYFCLLDWIARNSVG